MKTKVIIILLVFLTTFSCQDEDENFSFEYSVEHNFKVLNTYTSEDKLLSFSVAEVADSRCPKGVTCVWQGEARVTIVVENLQKDTLVLSTYDNKKDTIDNYLFELLDVSPYPEIDKVIEQSDYRVNLSISKLD